MISQVVFLFFFKLAACLRGKRNFLETQIGVMKMEVIDKKVCGHFGSDLLYTFFLRDFLCYFLRDFLMQS